MPKTTRSVKCRRCRRRYRGQAAWNGTFRAGVLLNVTCPPCQTAEENAEAVINEATLTYATTADGRVTASSKT